MASLQIHFGQCPICEGGLRRSRTCGLLHNDLHGFIMCDECEALWSEPTSPTHHFGSADSLACPVCGEAVWSENSHWSTLEDVCLLGWYSSATIRRIEESEADG